MAENSQDQIWQKTQRIRHCRKRRGQTLALQKTQRIRHCREHTGQTLQKTQRQRKKERKKETLMSSKAKTGPWDKWFTRKNGILTHSSKVKNKNKNIIKLEF